MKPLRQLLRRPTRRHYEQRGYCVFRGVFPAKQIGEVADLACNLLPAYRGKHLRQSGLPESNDFFPGTHLVRNPPFNLHLPLSNELEPLSVALQGLITSPALATRLRELDGAEHYIIHQTLLFFAAQTTGLHLDSWALDTVPHGFAHTIWIPLQDLVSRSGVPAIIPWPLGEVVTEAELGLPPEGPNHKRYERYHEALSLKLLDRSPDIASALVRRGDVMIWSSLTPHFTFPSQPFPIERLSLQVLLRPAHLSWGNFTVQPDYPPTHVMRATDRFSYFVSKEINRDFGIGELLIR